MKPLCIDLYCGLGGWTEGFLSEGWQVIGFDIERRPYPGELVIQDVLTLHGSQFKNADMIVGSSPCQEFSYRAMPFKRGKMLGPPLLGMKLFDAQFRIQREASEAAGRYIPMVVENVRGAQPWVGRAAWHWGSYYLWADVPALMPFSKRIKNQELGGGSWFAIGSPGQTKLNANPDGRNDGIKIPNNTNARRWEDRPIPRLNAVTKHENGTYSPSVDTFGWSKDSPLCCNNSHSAARKAASAQIAKIPFALAQYIASVYKPCAVSVK